MKYVVVKILGKEQIFVFPRAINHDRFCEVLSYIKHGHERDWSRTYAEPVSAGFVDGNGKCHGRSETMNLDSRGDLDSILLRGYGSN
jgi:hypothetical protein